MLQHLVRVNESLTGLYADFDDKLVVIQSFEQGCVSRETSETWRPLVSGNELHITHFYFISFTSLHRIPPNCAVSLRITGLSQLLLAFFFFLGGRHSRLSCSTYWSGTGFTSEALPVTVLSIYLGSGPAPPEHWLALYSSLWYWIVGSALRRALHQPQFWKWKPPIFRGKNNGKHINKKEQRVYHVNTTSDE